MAIDYPSATLPAERQPEETHENVAVVPAETTAMERVAGRCGARLQNRPGEVCVAPPVEGRRRCRVHGGLTPTGRDSPHFVHGRNSRFPVPLTGAEQTRYEQYVQEVFDPARRDLAGDLALARIQYERAVASGSSGVAEAGVVARLAAVHGRITAGRVIRVTPDEPAARALLAAIYGCLGEAAYEYLGDERAKALLALAAKKVAAFDWAGVGPQHAAAGASQPGT